MNLLFQGAQQTYDNPAFSGFGMQDSYRSSRWLASFTGLKQTYLWVHAVNTRHRCDTNLFSWDEWALWDLVRAKRACGKLQRCEEGRCSLRVSRKPSPRSTLSDPRNVPLSVIQSIMWLFKFPFMENTKWKSTCLSCVSIPIPLLLVFPLWFITMLCMFLMACCIVVISSLEMEILWKLSHLPFFHLFSQSASVIFCRFLIFCSFVAAASSSLRCTEKIWVILRCWGNSSMVEGQFSKWL